jgi:hypothetical protein
LRAQTAASEAYSYAAKKYGWTVIECCVGEEMRGKEDIHNEVYAAVRKALR